MNINWIVLVLMVVLIPLWPFTAIVLILCLRWKGVAAWVLFYRSTSNPSFIKTVGQRGVIDISRVKKVNGEKTFKYGHTRWQLGKEDNVWVPAEFNCKQTFNNLLDNYKNGLDTEEVGGR